VLLLLLLTPQNPPFRYFPEGGVRKSNQVAKNMIYDFIPARPQQHKNFLWPLFSLLRHWSLQSSKNVGSSLISHVFSISSIPEIFFFRLFVLSLFLTMSFYIL